MRILIVGAGVAGLTLAVCLQQSGQDFTIVERSPSLRAEGYMIDFFGSGYDVIERLGLLWDVAQLHHPIPRLAFLDGRGREKFSIDYLIFRRLFDGRHFNFMRGELVRLLASKLREPHRVLFGKTVAAVFEDSTQVRVRFSDGTVEPFDLVVGADGVHSQIRHLAFGEEQQFVRALGYYTAAFILSDAPRSLRARDAFYTLTVPGRQVGLYPIRGDRVATFFLHRTQPQRRRDSAGQAIDELRSVYTGLNWVVPDLLKRCEAQEIYFDAVEQIAMPKWSVGRVVLIGDACQCVSLLAGQGASFAVAGAYVLAHELTREGCELSAALASYEARVKPHIEARQEAGRRIGRWFVPETRVRLALRDLVLRLAAWPIPSRLLRELLAPTSRVAL